MPTAEQFRGEARTLTGHLEILTTMRRHIDDARGDVGLNGGSDALLIDRSLVGSTLNVDRFGQLVDGVIDELERRARLCDVYTQDLADWEVRYRQWTSRRTAYFVALDAGETAPAPGLAPVEPLPPFEGAEAG